MAGSFSNCYNPDKRKAKDMRTKLQLKGLALLGLIFAAAFTASAQQQDGDYQIIQAVINGGGAASLGGSFEITGTTGLHHAATSSGGGYTLSGGFWTNAGLSVTHRLSPISPAEGFFHRRQLRGELHLSDGKEASDETQTDAKDFRTPATGNSCALVGN